MRTLDECRERFDRATTRSAQSEARKAARQTAHALGVPPPQWAERLNGHRSEPVPIAALPAVATPPEVIAWARRTGGRIGFGPGGGVVVRGPITPRGPHVDRNYPTLAAAAAAVA